MAGFDDDRRDASERQFAHDEELRFKALARRNRLFGRWAAQRLGMTGQESEAYAKAVVAADFEEAGAAYVIRKVRQDLQTAGKTTSDVDLAGLLSDLMKKAVNQVEVGR